MAEGIFNDLANKNNLSVVAESFGVSTISGLFVSENSVNACAEIGIDVSKHRSNSVEDVDLAKYSKFYCMSLDHAKTLAIYFGVAPKKIAVLNISDPYGGNLEIYRMCRDEIFNSIKEIIKEYEN